MGKDEYETADALAPSAYPDDYMLNFVNSPSKRAGAANASATAARRPYRLEDPPRQGRGVPAGPLSRTCARAFACARALIETAWRVARRNGSVYVFGPDCLFVSSAVVISSRFSERGTTWPDPWYQDIDKTEILSDPGAKRM